MKPLTSFAAPQSLAQRLDSILLALSCFAMCSQIDVRRFGRDTLAEGLGYASKTFALSLSDVLFALLFLWFVARTAQLRAWKRLWWPPLPSWVLIFVMVLSLVHSPTIFKQVAAAGTPFTKETKDALADIVQFAGYFLVAPWVLVNLLRDRRDGTELNRTGIAIGALVAAFVASGLVGLVQLSVLKESAPRGFFSSPNVFAGFVAFTLPFLDELEIEHPRFSLVPIGLSLWVFGIAWLCVASPFAALAGGIGLVLSWIARPNPKKLRITRLAMIAFAFLFFAFTWTRNAQLAPYRADFLRLASAQQKVKKQWIEWQVASRWNSPRERAFATGYGPGNYQLNIGPLYYDLPNEEKMPPDSNNFYLVQSMSLGILGLGALLWVVWHFWKTAWLAARTGSWIGVGTFGALGAWLLVNPFHALLVRGVGLLLALFFALAVVARSNVEENHKSKNLEL